MSYYVDAQFERTYKTRQMVLKVEKEVDKYYINNMMNKCRQEKIEQRQLVQEARWFALPRKLLYLELVEGEVMYFHGCAMLGTGGKRKRG